MKEIKCKHYKGDGYGYKLDSKTTLFLCDCCNMNLAGEIAKQQAIQVFFPNIDEEK